MRGMVNEVLVDSRFRLQAGLQNDLRCHFVPNPSHMNLETSRKRPGQTGFVALALALTIGVLLTACTQSDSATVHPSTSEPTPVLHVSKWLIDSNGQVVITHGLDMIWKSAPYYPPTFSAQDAKFLVSEGFTGARIGFLWAGAEPSPGDYSSAYVQRIAHVNGVLGQYGIRTVVDFHQDNYSAKYGGDGAPLWASQGVTASDAFQNLWDDEPVGGLGLTRQFEGAWQRAATALAHASNLLGLDIFNEPYPGSSSDCGLFASCPQFETGQLPTFYRQLISTIRQVNGSALVFYEPIPTLTPSPTALPAPLSTDPSLGFSFHYYDRSCGTAPEPSNASAAAAQDARCTPTESMALDEGIAYAQRAGAAADLGEFGDSTNDTDNANMVDLADQRFLNWTYWEYYTTSSSLSPGLLIDDTNPGTESNARQSLLDALVVPYPEEVTGTPLSYSLDREKHHVFRLQH